MTLRWDGVPSGDRAARTRALAGDPSPMNEDASRGPLDADSQLATLDLRSRPV
jgi:hypothetical protein